MRLLWLSPLLLASVCLSLVPSEDQPSCGVFSAEQASGCSVASAHLRVPKAAEGPLDSAPESPRYKRSIKHKRRVKSHKRSRIVRSAKEDIEVSEDDDSPQQHHPRPVYSEEQLSLQVQGNLRNLINQLQTSSFLPAPRYCPHCRQLLPPEQGFIHQPIDPRMFHPVQHLPRFQAIPMKPSFPVSDQTTDFSNYDATKPRSFTSEEFCPLNYRITTEEDETHSIPPEFYNQTSSPNTYKEFMKTSAGHSNMYSNHESSIPNSRGVGDRTSNKEFKKTPAGLSDIYLDHEPYDETSPSPSLNNMEMVSFLKQSKLPAIEEITKFLEKKNS